MRTPETFSLLESYPSLKTSGLEVGLFKEKLLEDVIALAPKSNWMVTDLPMYAFRAGIPVPPEIAVLSEKRVLTDNIDDEYLINIVKQYDPELVLLGRRRYPILESYLEGNNYQIEYGKGEEIWFYLRKVFYNRDRVF